MDLICPACEDRKRIPNEGERIYQKKGRVKVFWTACVVLAGPENLSISQSLYIANPSFEHGNILDFYACPQRKPIHAESTPLRQAEDV